MTSDMPWTARAFALMMVLVLMMAAAAPTLAAAQEATLRLGLKDAVSYAVENSLQVRAARARAEGALHASAEAHRVAGLLGQLSGGGQGGGGSPSYEDMKYLVLYPLQAEVAYDVAQRGVRATEETVAAAVRQAYFACLQAEVGLEVAKAGEDLARRQEEAAGLMLKHGMGTKRETLAAQAKVAQAQASVASAERYVKAAKYALCALLGLGPDTELELVEWEFAYEPVSLSEDGLAAAAGQAVLERYEVYAQKRQLQVKEKDRELAREYPSYGDPSLVAVLAEQGIGAPESPYAAALAEAALEAAQAELDQAKLKVRQEVYQAYQELLDAQAAYEASAASVAEAEEGLRAAKEKLAQGAATNLDVQAAEFALLQAKANQRKLLYAWRAAREKYLHSKGKGMSLGQQGGAGTSSGAAGW